MYRVDSTEDPTEYDDSSSMRQLGAAAILDIATAGTSATLLAKRWESVLLVNVDDGTLTRLMVLGSF